MYGLHLSSGQPAVFSTLEQAEQAINSILFISRCKRAVSVPYVGGRIVKLQGDEGEYTVTRGDAQRYGL